MTQQLLTVSSQYRIVQKQQPTVIIRYRLPHTHASGKHNTPYNQISVFLAVQWCDTDIKTGPLPTLKQKFSGRPLTTPRTPSSRYHRCTKAWGADRSSNQSTYNVYQQQRGDLFSFFFLFSYCLCDCAVRIGIFRNTHRTARLAHITTPFPLPRPRVVAFGHLRKEIKRESCFLCEAA